MADGSVVLMEPSAVRSLALDLRRQGADLADGADLARRLTADLGWSPAVARLDGVARWCDDTGAAVDWLVDRVEAADLGLAIAGEGRIGAVLAFTDVADGHDAWRRGVGTGRALTAALRDGDVGTATDLLRFLATDPTQLTAVVAALDAPARDWLDAVLAAALPDVEQHDNVALDLLDGAWDAVVEGVRGLGGLTVQAAWDPEGAGQNWRDLAGGVGALVGLLRRDPVEAGRVVADAETFNANKARWVGQLLPDVVGKLLSGGTSTAISVPAMRRRIDALSEVAHHADDLEAARLLGLAAVDVRRVMHEDRIRPALRALRRGRSKRVHEVDTPAEVDGIFVTLLGASRVVEDQTDALLRYRLPDGTTVQYRPTTESTPGGPGIDVEFPTSPGKQYKVHLPKEHP